MDTITWDRNRFLKTLYACIVTASFLLWAIYQLLMQAKLGLPVECFFMAQVCVVLLIAPYLAAYVIHTGFLSTHSGSLSVSSAASLLGLSPISSGWQLLRSLLISQVPLLCWAFLSTAIAFFVTNTPFTKILQMFIILAVYSVSAAAVGVWGAQVFKDALFGAECAYLLWCVLIGGAFLLVPVDRYIGNIQPIIPLALHINPLVAVCYIFGMDPFHTPLLYDLTPIPSYLYAYTPWYIVGFWQLLIGSCCFLGAWRISNTYRRVL
jgi:hypothetical protein